MRRLGYAIAFVGLLLVVGCAAGPNGLANVANAEGEVAGFWLGLWHGAISPITFIISLFKDTVHFYEVHNSGALYNLGFVLGAGSLGGGSGAAASRK
ncbi:hypothetical protein CMK11_18355 [Candidatus Poribacteria bacterium]|nr:hypothetical protein [Candidatus Poribacteria bacterium]